jgi:cell division transport system permease protein
MTARGVDRALFWLLTFAAFAVAAAGLAARAVDRVTDGYQTDTRAYAIVRVIAPEGPEGVAAAELALSQSPHVTSAAPMTSGRAADLLAQWGGTSVAASDMPPLRLIEVELAPASEQVDVAGDIEAALAQGGVTGEFIAAPPDAEGDAMSDMARQIAFWGAVAVAAIMLLIVWLAARGLAGRRREMVTIMCDLGATQGQAAGRVADEAALLGLYAGAVGAAAAAIGATAALLLGVPGASVDALPGMIHPLDLVPIAAAPLGAAIAAGAGARSAAAYFHTQAARLG